MAGIKTVLEGDASSLISSMNKGEKSVNSVSKSFQAAKAQVEAFDAAARRNTMEQYDKSARKAAASVAQLTREMRGLSLVSNPSFSFGVGANPNMFPMLNNQLPKVTQNFRSANSVAIEFNRIIQDAPFGIIGVGNNITQLASAFGTLKNQAGSTGAALKATFASIFTSGNLISLGISAAITGFTLWQMHSQKAKRAQKELEDGTKTYIDTLKGLEQAAAKGQDDAQKDLVNLKLLYDATQNLTLPMEARKRAAKELIDQYPRQFKGMTTEAVLAGKAADAYAKLRDNILATAQAAAFANKITENASKQLNNILQSQALTAEVNKITKQIEDNAKAMSTSAIGAPTGASSAAQANVNARLEEKRLGILNQIKTISDETSNLSKENNSLQEQYNKKLSEGADASGKVKTNLDKTAKSTLDIVGLMNDLNGTLMSEFDRKVFEINNKYDEINKKIKEIGDAGKRADAFGLSTQARQAELLRAEVERILYLTQGIGGSKLRSTSGTIATAGSLPLLDETSKRINKAVSSDFSSEFSRQFKSSFRRGVSQTLNTFLSDIKDISKKTFEIEQKYAQLRSGASAEQIKALNKMERLEKQINNGFTRLLSGIGSTFGGIGSNILSAAISTGISEGNFKDLTNMFSGNNKWTGIGSLMSLIGTGIQGSTKRSGAGQVVGGMLAGAGSGAAIGSVVPGIGTAIGAAAGAIIGAVSGILSSSAARKQEKLQEAQLAEQRKQTAIMERANALAFQSSIAGQMTNQGLITNVDRSATGQLIARINGQDIEIILNRNGGRA